MPVNLLPQAELDTERRQASPGCHPQDRNLAEAVAVKEAIKPRAASCVPLIIGGSGVHSSGACKILKMSRKDAHSSVTTTSMGKDVVAGMHRLPLGFAGYYLDDNAHGRVLWPLVERAGVVLVVSNYADQNSTDSWRLYPRGARCTEIDIDSMEIGLNCEMLRLVADVSYSLFLVEVYLTSWRPGVRHLTPRGLAGLDQRLPLPIRAKLAAPDQEIVCLARDGGFAHTWTELETAYRIELDAPVIVLNNQILGYQNHAEGVLFGAHTDASDVAPVDHAAVTHTCDLYGMRVGHSADLASALHKAWAQEQPSLVDIITDTDARPAVTFYDNTYTSP